MSDKKPFAIYNKIERIYLYVYKGFIILAVAGFVVYRVVVFLRKPDSVGKIIDFIGGIGLCIGAILAFIIIGYLVSSLSSFINSRFRRQSKIFTARAMVQLMMPIDPGPVPEDLREDPNQASLIPISVNVSLTNYGLWIAKSIPKENKTPSPADESNPPADDIIQVFNNSMIIPMSGINLYYIICNYMGVFTQETRPSKSHGFKDRLPKVPKGNFFKIILIFSCFIKRDSMREIVPLEQPIKMKLMVQNSDGHDDILETSRLYKLIFDKKQEQIAQDDESWMYQSRPTYW